MLKFSARLDWLQSLSGLLLALFFWVHMFSDSSILLGQDVFRAVTQFYEGYPMLSEPLPLLTSLAAAGIFALVIVHALLAMRRFPANQAQHREFRSHSAELNHTDTRLWLVQLYTGIAIMFLLPVHLFVVIVQPDQIGPILSSQRIAQGGFWLLYLPLLICTVLHAAIGMYRLAVKWVDLRPGRRVQLRRVMWLGTVFFIALGLTALVAFVSIGLQNPPSETTHAEMQLIELNRSAET